MFSSSSVFRAPFSLGITSFIGKSLPSSCGFHLNRQHSEPVISLVKKMPKMPESLPVQRCIVLVVAMYALLGLFPFSVLRRECQELTWILQYSR